MSERIIALILDFVSQKLVSGQHDLARMLGRLSEINIMKGITTAGIFLFAAMTAWLGVLTIIVDVILQSYKSPWLQLSSVSGLGAALVLVGLGLFVIRVRAHRTTPKMSELAPLQLALAELVRDFVEERKLQREQQLSLHGEGLD